MARVRFRVWVRVRDRNRIVRIRAWVIHFVAAVSVRVRFRVRVQVWVRVRVRSGAAIQQCQHLQRGCVGRHLANRNEIRVSGSDSYALLFLLLPHTDTVVNKNRST